MTRLLMTATVMAAFGLSTVCLAQTAGDANSTAASVDVDRKDPYPEPMVVPQHWEFGIEVGKLRSISVQLAGRHKPQLFWYLPYTVTNKTDEDHIFVPEIILYTDTGELTRAGKSVPGVVFEKIKALHSDPLMKAPASMTGKLLQGQDNAKKSVAIWPDFDPNAGKLSVFIGGLSGETFSLPLPAPITVTERDWRGRERTITKDKLLLTKTLELQFAAPGEKASRKTLKPRLVKKRWVMR